MQHFSAWMTRLLHRSEDAEVGLARCLQLAELRYLVGSRAGSQSLAEQYVGLERASDPRSDGGARWKR